MTEGDFSNVAVANLPESLPVIDISLRILYKFRNNFYKEHIQKASFAAFHEILRSFQRDSTLSGIFLHFCFEILTFLVIHLTLSFK